MDTKKLKRLYKSYGFEELPVDNKDVLVFTLRNGHFHNADIVKVSDKVDVESTFQQLRKLNFACTVRNYSSLNEVEEVLFEGFFSAKETKQRLSREYEKHVNSIEDTLGVQGAYKYVEVAYTLNGEEGDSKLIDVITEKFESKRPTLILIEAAAGFGKTCTAFEVLNELLSSKSNKVPLFSELSRNRKAKIFRYVFLDEIDRSFPTLRSSLVQEKIKEGRVPVILDGFDELIHQSRSSDDDGYDAAEPMLDTIGELLEENSKVVLTTRRTAIFDGDAFHEWVFSHEDEFDVIRIRLKEPTISDWLTSEKIASLEKFNFPIAKLNNPVLLAYLRGLPEDEFEGVLELGDDIVKRYFYTLLEREQERQNLKLSVEEQLTIMRFVASDMVLSNYTSESKEYLEMLLSEKFARLLEKVMALYTSAERPSMDELITKITTHALLDRVGNSDNIGFINEFVLGNFVADVVIESDDSEWLGEQRFIEPAVMATVPRSVDRREMLWSSIRFALEFQAPADRVLFSQSLCGELRIDLTDDTLSAQTFRDLNLGKESKVKRFLFLDCIFQDCNFFKENFEEVTFVNCHFYGCSVADKHKAEKSNIELVNNHEDGIGFLDSLGTIQNLSKSSLAEDDKSLPKVEEFILSKFWPKGRPRAHKHRPTSILYSGGKFTPSEIHSGIDSLKAKEILSVPDKSNFLELNISKIAEIKELIGKESNYAS
ncbi:hypothetical protein EST55_03975 [Idiomarina sp. 29L]|uniref:hypothetical protein n=1 Tax=Idiomarina sp. 29L TaxID=2508877 RepID=UPI001012746A|nr:hypothetical protein [Idiomarina sp. 29L]RXS42920.1 hypothetical protein EST55_03975 [Idiomarina sp. 29L]